MAKQKSKRDRGHLLTNEGLARLDKAIAQWQEDNERKCTQAIIQELSGGLDPKTISKIRKRKAGTDIDSIRRLFGAFGLELENADHHIPLEPGEKAEFDRNFVGRENAIAHLNHLATQNHRIIVIQAKGGVGKTTLAQQYLKTQGFDKVLELWMAKETQNIASVEGVIEEWLRRDFDEEPGREFGVTLERLRQKLRDPGLRIGVLIDNLEPALDSAGKFVTEHRRYVELLRVLGDGEARSLTLITSRERLRESAVSVQPYLLSSLDLEAWRLRFEARQVQMDDEALADIHRAYGGNAKAMEILCSAILQDYQGDLAAYWEVNQDDLLLERDLEDLVVGQFERLREQDPDAYKLLCRMGCYRYQDVPTVPLEGLLCLLWDVPERKRKRVVRRLQERSVAESSEDYWLHPVVRAEAIERLRNGADWNIANQKAAEFWLASVASIESIETALKALEPYHHYVAISDLDSACKVVTTYRPNSWALHSGLSKTINSSLGGSFIRLGLLQQIFRPVHYLSEKVSTHARLDKIYNILGDSYWLSGNLHKAMDCHKKSGELAAQENDSYLEVAAIFNSALCYEYLWEIDDALKAYQTVLKIAKTGGNKRYEIQSSYCLAYLYSYLKNKDKAKQFMSTITPESAQEPLGIRTAGYRLYALGFSLHFLGSSKQANSFYMKAIEYARASSFLHLEALVIGGLAVISRDLGCHQIAMEQHEEAIDKFLQLGSRIDLAEAYYQKALTSEAFDEFNESKLHYCRAIDVFHEMKAPKQVERVKQRMFSLPNNSSI